MFGKSILFSVLPETQALYGFLDCESYSLLVAALWVR
jgi:hypothetical protein